MRNLVSIVFVGALSYALAAQVIDTGVSASKLPTRSDRYKPTGSIGRSGFAEGKKYRTSATREEVRGTPTWTVGDAHPPLSPRKAEQLASTRMVDIVGQPDRWILSEISLLNTGDGEHWMYDVCCHGLARVLQPRGTAPDPSFFCDDRRQDYFTKT